MAFFIDSAKDMQTNCVLAASIKVAKDKILNHLFSNLSVMCGQNIGSPLETFICLNESQVSVKWLTTGSKI